MTQRWVKFPKPGQFRGDGDWIELEKLKVAGYSSDEYWEYLQRTSFLPTHVGEAPPMPKDTILHDGEHFYNEPSE